MSRRCFPDPRAREHCLASCEQEPAFVACKDRGRADGDPRRGNWQPKRANRRCVSERIRTELGGRSCDSNGAVGAFVGSDTLKHVQDTIVRRERSMHRRRVFRMRWTDFAGSRTTYVPPGGEPPTNRGSLPQERTHIIPGPFRRLTLPESRSMMPMRRLSQSARTTWCPSATAMVAAYRGIRRSQRRRSSRVRASNMMSLVWAAANRSPDGRSAQQPSSLNQRLDACSTPVVSERRRILVAL